MFKLKFSTEKADNCGGFPIDQGIVTEQPSSIASLHCTTCIRFHAHYLSLAPGVRLYWLVFTTLYALFSILCHIQSFLSIHQSQQANPFTFSYLIHCLITNLINLNRRIFIYVDKPIHRCMTHDQTREQFGYTWRRYECRPVKMYTYQDRSRNSSRDQCRLFFLFFFPSYGELAVQTGRATWPRRLTSWTLPRVGSLGYSLSISYYPSLFSGLPYVQWREQLYPVARLLFARYTRRFCFPIIIRYTTNISLVIFNRWRIFSRLFTREFRSCRVLILYNVSRSGWEDKNESWIASGAFHWINTSLCNKNELFRLFPCVYSF